METVTLGPTGTYSHRAASAVTDDGISFVESVRGIADAVANGDADRGVVPIENSIEGSVTETLDALSEVDLAVVREIVTPVRHALIAQSENFDTVASHSQALAQVRTYLDENYPDVDREPVASTARSVEIARDDPTVAGIAHPDNADGDLQVVASDIQDQTSNSTRFFVVAPPSERSDAGGKSSFVVYPNANYPGLLLELLEPFADRDINLSRVESRPSGERLGDYLFHIDVDAGLYEERTQAALDDIEAIADKGWVRRLGSYDVEHVV
ncbi:prephenate dehydratase [Halobacterium sp. KA-4]|jgi:prephenate dehydratase|uniref:prephenate dehydratase n=1 Tax=Halobacterium sp. KA-4 TaxID=2896367 RepID=UPI001E54ACE4|nr:prephenate dehydratase [Halobacterium sp. KA-4]MCD2200241.1 prephenate dehydratase [Halobacterium sp. KA-4]